MFYSCTTLLPGTTYGVASALWPSAQVQQERLYNGCICVAMCLQTYLPFRLTNQLFYTVRARTTQRSLDGPVQWRTQAQMWRCEHFLTKREFQPFSLISLHQLFSITSKLINQQFLSFHHLRHALITQLMPFSVCKNQTILPLFISLLNYNTFFRKFFPLPASLRGVVVTQKRKESDE